MESVWRLRKSIVLLMSLELHAECSVSYIYKSVSTTILLSWALNLQMTCANLVNKELQIYPEELNCTAQICNNKFQVCLPKLGIYRTSELF